MLGLRRESRRCTEMRKLRREMERVYDQHGSQLFTCALAVTRSPELAEDAVHEAFCRGLRLSEGDRPVASAQPVNESDRGLYFRFFGGSERGGRAEAVHAACCPSAFEAVGRRTGDDCAAFVC